MYKSESKCQFPSELKFFYCGATIGDFFDLAEISAGTSAKCDSSLGSRRRSLLPINPFQKIAKSATVLRAFIFLLFHDIFLLFHDKGLMAAEYALVIVKRTFCEKFLFFGCAVALCTMKNA
jgi:hypothetical protein